MYNGDMAMVVRIKQHWTKNQTNKNIPHFLPFLPYMLESYKMP